jgi:hypothetical protein
LQRIFEAHPKQRKEPNIKDPREKVSLRLIINELFHLINFRIMLSSTTRFENKFSSPKRDVAAP